MAVFILSFILLVVVVLAMSVGVLLGKKPIKGSCGGMSALGMDTACDVCGGDRAKCEEEQEKQQISQKEVAKAEALAYDASASGTTEK